MTNAQKRLFDVVIAGLALILTAPLMAAVAVVSRVSLGSPLLFKQVRTGLHGKPFTLVKFRTMRPVNTAKGEVADADRMTPLGAKLRASSLDELPTLWNVLRGDMSLVGPRPLLPEYLELYTQQQARRHMLKPGVTGLAQVSGRNGLSWPEKLALDVEYVDRQTLALDVRILFRTFAAVFDSRHVNQPGHVTSSRLTDQRAKPGESP